MITTLGLWQIVGLIALTQIAVVILNRLVILTAMVLTRRWSLRTPNPMSANEKNLLSNASFGEVDQQAWQATTRHWPGQTQEGIIHESHSLPAYFDALEGEGAGSTGVQPGGVSWIPPDEKVNKPSVLGLRSNKSLRRIK